MNNNQPRQLDVSNPRELGMALLQAANTIDPARRATIESYQKATKDEERLDAIFGSILAVLLHQKLILAALAGICHENADKRKIHLPDGSEIRKLLRDN